MDPNQQTPQYNPVPSDKSPGPEYQPAADPNKEHQKINPLSAMQKDEKIIADIHRHPFGIISLYFFAFVGFAAACGIILLLIPKLTAEGAGNVITDINGITIAILGAMLVLMIIILALVTTVYWQNRWVITSDSVTQISQHGLFNRQVSQLSFGNLEDVTAEQKGIIPSMFNFGTLRIQSAGEHSKFFFLYCPKPDFYARQILMAREIFLQNELGGQGQRRLNRL